MNARIEQITPAYLMQTLKLSGQEAGSMGYWLTCTQHLWAGIADDELVCAWGLVPPTLLSDTALLWLYDTPAVEQHKFTFIRRSQLAVEEMLKLYPRITGVTLYDADRSRKWIEWLGGTYGKREGKIMPFTIEQRAG